MSRLIDADALKRDVKRWFASTANRERMKEALDSAPTIEAEPVRHGRWIMVRDRNNHPLGVKCSECGRRVKNSGENYCPKCGSKMDKEA